MIGRIRVSRTLAGGQRSELGRYKVHWEVSLSDFGLGMINDDLHVVGIWHVVTDRLKRAVVVCPFEPSSSFIQVLRV